MNHHHKYVLENLETPIDPSCEIAGIKITPALIVPAGEMQRTGPVILQLGRTV